VFQTILIATDLTDNSHPALRMGLRLAKEQGAAVVILHVLELWLLGRKWLAGLSDLEIGVHRQVVTREREAARRQVEVLVTRACEEGLLETPQVEIQVLDGHAAEAIVEVADRAKSGLLIIGTRRQGELLGSVAERIVRLAQQPVLVVPAERS
jgi:nucleotide-binding universal stress UspA family protein